MTPFTSVERATIRHYLGWSSRFRQSDFELDAALSAVDVEPDDSTRDIILGVMADIADIGTRLTDALSRLKAKKVGSIDLPGTTELGLLRSEGRRFVGQLAATLGVGVRHDIFKGAGPQSSFGSYMPGGNYTKQG